ncbi:MAG: hypothetical protein GF375_04655, partial [Candidatus Omnitrophica bacterium]|nr:hypothetical protein [Candidatus Omnitrophota bacterium]
MFKEYIEALKNIFFPPLCFNCETKITRGFLCRSCFEKIIFLTPPRCNYCSKPLKNGEKVCTGCRKEVFSFDKMISAVAYSPPVINLIHYFKYRYCDYLAGFLASLI